ncbi:hypothetical protein SRABI04_02601 [Chryseobacterium sp. Bi04]|nr:hypothetical protein SRABI04_02601 [Chryseobacterium sp. Bi04]
MESAIYSILIFLSCTKEKHISTDKIDADRDEP